MSKARASDLHLAVRQSLQQAKALVYYGGGRAVTALEQPELILLDQLLTRARDLSADLPMQTRAVIEACAHQVHGWIDGHGAFPRVFDRGDVLERLHDNLRGVLADLGHKVSDLPSVTKDERLLVAVLAGDVNAMRSSIVAGGEVHMRRPGTNDTLLHLAAAKGHEHVCQALLEAGLNPNAPNVEGRTALHESAYLDTPAVWNRLIEAGAKDNIQDRQGQSPTTLRDSLIWGKAMVDHSHELAYRTAHEQERELSMGR